MVLLFSGLWVTHPAILSFDFIEIVHLLPSHCGFFLVFEHGVSSFCGFQCPSVNGCSTASCNFGALAGEGEQMFFYSVIWKHAPPATILVWEIPWAEDPGKATALD